MCKKTPHKHAEVIKAWADGAEIQFRDNRDDGWYLVCGDPLWNRNLEYRVKPQPIFFRAYQAHGCMDVSTVHYNEGDKLPSGYEWVSEPFEVKLIS